MILSLVDKERLARILQRMFDSEEFLSPYGIRSLSKSTGQVFANVGGRDVSIEYEPGESRTGLFGGNSNWRGPVWFPVNVLLADKLRVDASFFREMLLRKEGKILGRLDARVTSEDANPSDNQPECGARAVDTRSRSIASALDADAPHHHHHLPARDRAGVSPP